MVENIEAVLKRGERLEDLLVRTDALSQHSDRFKTSAVKLRKTMWYIFTP